MTKTLQQRIYDYAEYKNYKEERVTLDTLHRLGYSHGYTKQQVGNAIQKLKLKRKLFWNKRYGWIVNE